MKRRYFIHLGAGATAAAAMLRQAGANEITQMAKSGDKSNGPGSTGITITGNWKLSLEDRKEFSQPGYDDAHWTELETLGWKQPGKNTTANTTLWVRKKVVIPSSLKAEFEKTGALTLAMGKIQQSDQTWLNGKLIGQTGSGASYRNYLLHQDDILWDQENSIAIRVGHWGVFGMSKVPTLAAAAPEHILAYAAGLADGNPKQQVMRKDLQYQLAVTNKSVKPCQARVQAEFFGFDGARLHSAHKEVTLVPGLNQVRFAYRSPSPFVKVVYRIAVPSYAYAGAWNSEIGYHSLSYRAARPVVPYRAPQAYVPAGLDSQSMRGWLGERLDANLRRRLHKVDEDALLAGFINRPGNHSWIGEHIGKFLEAACNSYANNADPALKIQIDRSAQQLIAAQLDDGYLGTYEQEGHWTSWDVWSHRYNLIGLLRYYELSGFQPALRASERIADLVMATFGPGPGQRDVIKSGPHVGMAATCMLESMAELYRFSGDRKYLDYCGYLLKSFDAPGGPRILTTIRAEGRLDKVANGKAYEMMSNFLGVLKLYRLTDDEGLLAPMLTAWDDVVSKRMYITGTTSSFEHFQDDHVLPAEVKSNMGEGCVTTTWIQFNYQLFCITGEPKYLDELERAVYNHLTGALNPQTGGVSYYTPLNGVKPHGTSITCCMSSVPRAIAMIPLFASGRIDGAPAILLYQPGSSTIRLDNREKTAVAFETVTTFPNEGKVSITVNPAKAGRFKVLFRKPEWAEDFVLAVNGKPVETGRADMVPVERLWKRGDRVEIGFAMPLKMHDGGLSYPGKKAIQRGPQVFAFDRQLNKVDARDVRIAAGAGVLEQLPRAALPTRWIGSPAYRIDAMVDGRPGQVLLVPYADAGQGGGHVTTWLTGAA